MVACKQRNKWKKPTNGSSRVSYSIIQHNNTYKLLQRSENNLKIVSYIPLYPIVIENPMNVFIMIGDEYCCLKQCDSMFYKVILYEEWTLDVPQSVLMRWFSQRHIKFSNK